MTLNKTSWRKRNIEKALQDEALYRKEHRKEIAIYHKLWREKNKEHLIEWRKGYYKKNIERERIRKKKTNVKRRLESLFLSTILQSHLRMAQKE